MDTHANDAERYAYIGAGVSKHREERNMGLTKKQLRIRDPLCRSWNKFESTPKTLIKKEDLTNEIVNKFESTPKTLIKKEASIFEKATKIVGTDRSEDYGDPIDMCEHIASLWSAYLKTPEESPLKASDVSMMMILMKVAREKHNHKEDNLIDIMGYAAITDTINNREKDELT